MSEPEFNITKSDRQIIWKAIEYAEVTHAICIQNDEEIKYFQTCGLVVRSADCGCDEPEKSDLCSYANINHVPFTLYPTEIQKSTFNTISSLQRTRIENISSLNWRIIFLLNSYKEL